MLPARQRICPSIDRLELPQAAHFLRSSGLGCTYVKIGQAFYTKYDKAAIALVTEQFCAPFVDLRLFNQPKIVRDTVFVLANQGVRLITVHMIAREEVITAAVEAAREASQINDHDTQIIGVSLLTLYNKRDLIKLGWLSNREDSARALAGRLAKRAHGLGMVGALAHLLELEQIRQLCGDDFMTFGIGFHPWGHPDELRNLASITNGIVVGVDYVTIGDSLLNPPAEIGDSKAAMAMIEAQITEGMAKKRGQFE